eukprot:9401699-Pyramimonas_sp.AAC.2
MVTRLKNTLEEKRPPSVTRFGRLLARVQVAKLRFDAPYATAFGNMVWTSVVRALRTYWRQPEYNFSRIAFAAFAGLLFGSLWRGAGENIKVRVDVKGYGVDPKGCIVDLKGYGGDSKGCVVDLKGYGADLIQPACPTASCTMMMMHGPGVGPPLARASRLRGDPYPPLLSMNQA